MQTTTDRAAELRAEYKQLGWNSRMISVRSDHFSMGSAIRVELKDARVNAAKAEALANGAEEIRRDGYGEILSGGNLYVSIHYASSYKEVLSRRHFDALLDAVSRLDPNDRSRLEEVMPDVLVGFDGASTNWIRFWIDGHTRSQFYFDGACDTEQGIKDGAFKLALLLEARKVQP